MKNLKTLQKTSETNTLLLCEYCIEAIKSHGDKIRILDEWDPHGMKNICDFCGDNEGDETLYICEIY